MRTARLPRSVSAVDTATALAAVDRRDRLAHLTPVVVSVIAAAGLLVLALTGA